jgi:hypothetical protein
LLYYTVSNREGKGIKEMQTRRATYPILPERWWWALRTRFKQTVPQKVTAAYLADVLNVGEETAAKIAMPAIRKLGLIDRAGKPQERAVRWRDDNRYKEVCAEIVRELYPEELENIAKDENDRQATEDWFAMETAAGSSAVKKMASMYFLLRDGTLRKEEEGTKRTFQNHVNSVRPSRSRITKVHDQPYTVQALPGFEMPSGLNENQHVPSIPPALEGLIRSLPPAGTAFPKARREQWLQLVSQALIFIYSDEDGE